MRTSKLQKFILKSGYDDCFIMRRHFKEFYGIRGSGWGSGLGNAKRATMSNCRKNLFEKGLIEEKGKFVVLTEKGVDVLKANGSHDGEQTISYKEYIKRVDETIGEYEKFWESTRKMLVPFREEAMKRKERREARKERLAKELRRV